MVISVDSDDSSSSSDSDDSGDSGSESDVGDFMDDGLGDLVIDERPKELRTAAFGGGIGGNADKRGRTDTRGHRRAISALADGVKPGPSQGPPPRKKSRSTSRVRSRSQSPLELPPPEPQPTRELENAALDDYLKKVALMSKSYIQETNPHRGLGQRPESLRPINCVSRGGMSMSSLRRWTRKWGGPFASDGGYAEGYYDADDTYYKDPEALNPRKPIEGQGVVVATDVNAPGPSTQMDETPSRVSPTDAVGAGIVAIPPGSPSILKPTRSFEQRPQVRLPRGCKKRIIKVNIAGVLCNVMDDRDEDTGRMEDRRSQWTIDRNVAAAAVVDSYSSMSEEEYEDAMVLKEEKKAQRKHVRLRPQRLRAKHANANDSVVHGDDFVGHQAGAISKTSKKMAELLVQQTLEWTSPRLDGQSRPSLQWIDVVDRAVDVDGGFVGKFTSCDSNDPLEDVTLIRAEAGVDHKIGTVKYCRFLLSMVYTF